MTHVARNVRRRPVQQDRQGRRQRVVILGASNVSRSFPTLLSSAQSILEGPLEVLTAAGHGRSYVGASQFLVRTLPGIASCGIWPALEHSLQSSTAALVTDIGNDIMYGARPEEIMRSVDLCLDRLEARQARTVVTLLPVCNAGALSRRGCRILLRLFYPRCQLSASVIGARAIELNELVQRSAARRGIATVPPEPDWYGFDPLHVRAAHFQQVWRTVLRNWGQNGRPQRIGRSTPLSALRYHTLRPHVQRLLGSELTARQPALALRDGTTIALY